MTEQLPAGGPESDSRAEGALPLAGDTGATSPVLGIDWLAITLYGVEPDVVAGLVSEALHPGRRVELVGWERNGGARFYGSRHEYLGVTLLSACQARGAQENVHLVLPGEVCSTLGLDALLQLLDRCRMWSERCQVARLDLVVDRVPFTPADGYRAVLERQTVAWAKRGRDGRVSHTWNASNGAGEGNTLYIGRRSSERWLRIYDRRGPTRVELETKRAYAGAVAAGLVERRGDPLELARFVVGCLREYCDFGTQDGRHGARELQLLPWWQAFIASTERIGRLVADRRTRLSVDRTLGWLDRAVIPSLAMVKRCYGPVGDQLLEDWIAAALPHLSERHEAAIREFQYAYGQGLYRVLEERDAS